MPSTMSASTSAAAAAGEGGRRAQLIGAVVGILGFFVAYGYLQEKIMSTAYGDERTRFTDSAFLVLCNRIVAIAMAVAMTAYRGESFRPIAPLGSYLVVAMSNFVATYSQYEALKYVSFPTQTLGKCGKMVPVMVIGAVVDRKSYTFRDYALALLLTFGCFLFLLTGTISAKHATASDSMYGLLLMAVYLLADGMTSTTQERMFRGYTMSTYNQMLYVNLFSAGLSLLVLMPGGRLTYALNFAVKFPELLRDAFLLSLAASLGQQVIYFTIKTFGALTYSTIMTVRQFLSLLLSSILFLNPLSFGQWLGSAIVFGVLYAKDSSSSSKSGRATLPTTTAANGLAGAGKDDARLSAAAANDQMLAKV